MKETAFKKKINTIIPAIAVIGLAAFTLLLTRQIKNHAGYKETTAVLSGDVNADGLVNILDFQLLSNTFGKSLGQAGYNPNADFNADNRIDILDFQILSNNFGNTANSTPTPTMPPLTSCLTRQGPLITLSGSKTSYRNRSLPNTAKIDASQATFTNGGENPVDIGGGSDICWSGGKIFGGYPLNADWHTTHPTSGIEIHDGSDRFTVENIYIDQIGDGIKVRLGEVRGQAGIAEPFTIRGVWLRDIRDDCVESDWQAGALLEDNLFDGCYTVFATKKRDGANTNGSNNTWEIRNTLAYMHDQIGVYRGESPGHSLFFKWDETSPKWKMYNSILRVDSNVGQSSEQFNFRLNKLAGCANNILVWLGPGSFPGALPDCFTVTNDRSVWDNAVRNWKIRHGFTE